MPYTTSGDQLFLQQNFILTKLGSELAARQLLTILKALPEDAGYSPTKAKDGCLKQTAKGWVSYSNEGNIKESKGIRCFNIGPIKPESSIEFIARTRW